MNCDTYQTVLEQLFFYSTDYGYSTAIFSQEPEPPRPSFAAPIEPVPAPSTATVQHTSDNIFAHKAAPKDLDVTSIITKRLNAMRKLQDNPMDSEAIKLMYKTQKDVRVTVTNFIKLFD